MSRRTSSLGPGSGTASRSPDRRVPRRRCGSVAMSYSKIVHRMTSCGDQGAQPARLNATVPTAFIPPGNIAAASRRICSRQTRPRGPTPPSSRYRTTDQPTRQTGGSQPKRRNGLEPDADHERSVNVLQMVACSRGSSSGSTLEPGSGSARRRCTALPDDASASWPGTTLASGWTVLGPHRSNGKAWIPGRPYVRRRWPRSSSGHVGRSTALVARPAVATT
jgi:hypothetical protein